jgi:hypothetical protein
LFTVEEEIVVVARVVLPETARVPFDVSEDVAVIEPPVTLLEVRVVKKALIPERKEATRPVDVVVPLTFAVFALKLVMVPEAAVVVEKVEVPMTENFPVAVEEARSERKVVFSVQLDPFQ